MLTVVLYVNTDSMVVDDDAKTDDVEDDVVSDDTTYSETDVRTIIIKQTKDIIEHKDNSLPPVSL